MNHHVHKTEGVNRTETMRFHTSTFTGKEKDEETGYSHFGARYYDSDLSGLFLSVDPMADKYPSISPYAYCAWNPLKLVDPDGEKWETTKDEEKAKNLQMNANNRITELNNQKTTLNNNNSSEELSDKTKYELSEIDNQIALLNDFVKGIDELSESDIRYTFNPTRSQYIKVRTYASLGSLYKINFQSGNDGNLVHEVTHAIQVDRYEHDRIERLSPMGMEQNAYSTQFSFSPNSMPESDSSIIPSSKILPEWVRKVYYFDNGKKYPYEKYE